MEYVLQTNAVKKDYGKYKALNGLTMHVPKGSIYGFVGKNGAGKTTLIRIICGLQRPTSGEIEIYGAKYGTPAIVENSDAFRIYRRRQNRKRDERGGA